LRQLFYDYLRRIPLMEIDPVCKMEVDPATAQWKSEYKGRTYYFCAPGCKASFEKDPEKYLAQAG
jgi:Cu+-exporting ATPase